MTVRLEGKPVAEATETEVRAALATAPAGTPPPGLVSVHRGEETPYRFYVRRQARAAAALGIRFRDEVLGGAEDAASLARRLGDLDRDPAVHAVIVEHPLPDRLDFARAVESLSPAKDVDGVSALSLGRLVARRALHVPAVARAAYAIARHYRLPLDGEPVAVLGRSPTVGLPLALLLSSPSPGGNATVTLVHSRTKDLRAAVAGARTIFSCVGRPNLLDRTVVPQGSHVVDVGLTSTPDPNRPGASKTVGDANAASLDGWAGSLTPVPGGVGPVTVAELMANTVRAWQRHHRAGDPG